MKWLILIFVGILLALAIAVFIKTKDCCKHEKFTPLIYAENAGYLDTSMQGGSSVIKNDCSGPAYCEKGCGGGGPHPAPHGGGGHTGGYTGPHPA